MGLARLSQLAAIAAYCLLAAAPLSAAHANALRLIQSMRYGRPTP